MNATCRPIHFLMLGAGANMSDDPPPPYTAVDETKINQITLTGQLPGPLSYYPHDGQPLPHHLVPAYPSAPPGYRDAVVYYPAPPNSADAAVLLQPQRQPQVITIQQPAQSDHPDVAEARRSHTTDLCRILCCMCLCCSCPFLFVGFI